MKSLNRTLSLVLVLAMCLGMIGVASAASFTDSTAVTYKEAVDVMTTIGVFNGLDTGKFDPTGSLTREQAAKILCYLTMGKTAADALKASSAPFSDVAADRWSAGSIAYCVQQGIVSGKGDGTFAPTAGVTGYEFAKMLLVALGYDATVEQFTGASWSINVAKRAFANKLFTGNSAFNGNAALTREEAALYSLNLLNAKLVTYASKGTEIIVNGTTIKQGASAPAQGAADFKSAFFSALKLNDSGADVLGRTANVWTYKGLEIGKYASGADFTFTAAAAGSTDAAKIAAMGFTGYTLNGGTVTPKVNGVDGTPVTTLAGLAALTANGTVVEVYVDSTDSTKITRIVVVNNYLAQVTSINTVAKLATVKTVNGTTYTVDNSLNPKVYTALAAMAVKDYVLITPTAVTAIAGLAAPKTVTGTVTKITTGTSASVTVGGTAYSLSANQVDVSGMDASTMTAKANVTLYLDSYGYAIYVTNATSTTPYFAVVKTSSSLVNGNIVTTATGYATDGTVVTLNTGSVVPTKGAVYAYAAATSAEVAANNSEYTLTPVAQLALGATLVKGKYVTNVGVAITAGSTTLAGKAADTNATAAVPYTSDVKFIFMDAATSTITVKTGAQAVAAGTAMALITQKTDGTFVIPVVYVNAAPSDVTGASILYLAKATGTEYKDGITYNAYGALIDGAPAAILTKGDNSANIGFFCSYAKDDTTGIYTLAKYGDASGAKTLSTNSTVVNNQFSSLLAGYLFSTVAADGTTATLTNLNAANATIVDLTGTGLYGTLSDISAAKAAGKTVITSVIYDNSATSSKLNTVSYIYVVGVVTPVALAGTPATDTFVWDTVSSSYKLTAAATHTGTLTLTGLPTGVTVTAAAAISDTAAHATASVTAAGVITVTSVAAGTAKLSVTTSAGILVIPVTVA